VAYGRGLVHHALGLLCRTLRTEVDIDKFYSLSDIVFPMICPDLWKYCLNRFAAISIGDRNEKLAVA
jgi:hypothetical protein